jgi:glycosyltransferase involved in cell wall biosynthesis|tara:strand:- start:3593 stop:4525 length:933 start_codon:yes stop_codon:yes gene_type:complete
MYKENKIFLIIPAYNEEKLIVDTLSGVPDFVDKIVLIDDGSTDKTAEIVGKIQNNKINLVQHTDNKGIGAAIITGYKIAISEEADIAVVVGGDNQMDLKEMANFLEPIIKGDADYTKGNRFLTPSLKEMPSHRLIGNSMLSLLSKLSTGYWKIFDSNDGYTAISKKALKSVDWDQAWRGYGYNADFLARLNIFNIKVKDIPRRAIYIRGERQSQIRVGRYIWKVAPHLTRLFFWRLKEKYILRDFHPLVLFYLFGIIILPLGVGIGLFLLWSKIIGGAIAGSTAVLAALLIITGLQFLLFALFFDMEANK